MNYLTMITILDAANAEIVETKSYKSCHILHNKYETSFLKRMNSVQKNNRKKNSKNAPAQMRHVRKLRW